MIIFSHNKLPFDDVSYGFPEQKLDQESKVLFKCIVTHNTAEQKPISIDGHFDDVPAYRIELFESDKEKESLKRIGKVELQRVMSDISADATTFTITNLNLGHVS